MQSMDWVKAAKDIEDLELRLKKVNAEALNTNPRFDSFRSAVLFAARYGGHVRNVNTKGEVAVYAVVQFAGMQ